MTKPTPKLYPPAEKRIRAILADVYQPEGVDIVMRSRNSSLHGRSPLDLLTDGRDREVLEWARSLASGNPEETTT